MKKKIKKWAKDLNNHFYKEDIQMTPKHMKRCAILLIMIEMQIKATMMYFTSIRTAIIKRYRNHKCWEECREKGTLAHYWWEWKMVQPLWKTKYEFLKKLTIELSWDPDILHLSMYPEKVKLLFKKIHASRCSEKHY